MAIPVSTISVRVIPLLSACSAIVPSLRLGGINLLYHYYQHVAPYMDYMKQELMAQRPPSNIMKVL